MGVFFLLVPNNTNPGLSWGYRRSTKDSKSNPSIELTLAEYETEAIERVSFEWNFSNLELDQLRQDIAF